MARFPHLRLAFLAALLLCGHCQAAPASSRLPNVLLILADGMGYSDAGCYGGEIATPCLDWLAGNGIRFSQAYNAGAGMASEASLLSGFYQEHLDLENKPLYSEGTIHRPAWDRGLPELLKPAGYHSYHIGQWHQALTPNEAGFEHSYAIQEKGAGSAGLKCTLDGSVVESVADTGTSTAIADQTIQFLTQHAERQPKEPFLACVEFLSPHVPLAALTEDLENYRRRFQRGTDELRMERLQRLWDAGMLLNAELSPPTLPARRWAELSRTEQEAFETRMELHAAMIDRMDREIGRILERLVLSKVWENTLVIFLSNSGARAERVAPGAVHASKGTTVLSLEAQGASLANTPFRYSQKFAHEGGIATPMIVFWPAGIKARGELREQVVHAIDIAPTVVKAAGIPWPKHAGAQQTLPDGVDLSAVFKENKNLAQRGLWWRNEGNCGFRLGDWKWVVLKNKPAELYYLRADRAEMLDLAPANHERVMEMGVQWQRMLDGFRKDLAQDVPAPVLSVAQ